MKTMTDHHPFQSPKAKATFLASYEARAQLWPIPSTAITIATPYGQTFVRISGPEAAPPLVLLHGHSENGLNWWLNIEDLSQNYRTYAIDTISDPGRSMWTKRMTGVDDYTTWLDQLFDGLGLEGGVNLLGLSYGGWLVSQYALRFPRRLHKVVLMAPAGVAAFSLRFLMMALPLSFFGFRFKFWFKRMTQWMCADFLACHANGETQFNDWFEFLYLGIRSHKPQPTVFAKVLTHAQLQQLKMPTLFLTGENEIVYDVEKAIKRFRTVAPHIQTQVIANAGHDLPLAQPQATNQAVLQFLKADT